MIRLAEDNRETLLRRAIGDLPFNVVQRRAPVYLRFANAKKIEIGAVKDMYRERHFGGVQQGSSCEAGYTFPPGKRKTGEKVVNGCAVECQWRNGGIAE